MWKPRIELDSTEMNNTNYAAGVDNANQAAIPKGSHSLINVGHYCNLIMLSILKIYQGVIKSL